VQACRVTGAIIVTTPQEVAVGDALRGAKMFERVGVPVLGVVENMSGFECPGCGRHHALFGEGGGQRLAEEIGVPLLGKVPLQEGMVEEADAGRPIVVSQPGTPAAQALSDIAATIRREHSGRGTPLPILRG
ncbi:MAG: P-loop NTPase, partial [Gemmatimonadales bacterium]